MRLWLAALLAVITTTLAHAEDYYLDAPVVTARLYNREAELVREAKVTVHKQGMHRIIVSPLLSDNIANVSLGINGARLTGQGAFTSVYDWMANWGANHTATGYGHFGADLITLASMLRIPVYMHNVERERILRPKAWVPFGTAEPESADFRACATFGPLYR